MSAETTIHVHLKRDDPFARVPKTVLNDTSLSWKAKGLLAYLLGKPSDWKVYVTDLVKRSTDKHAAVKTGLKELRTAGYARLECVRDRGKVAAWKWHVSDTPQFKNVNNSDSNSSPEVDFPLVENQQVENPQVGNPLLLRSDQRPRSDQKPKKTTTTNRGGESQPSAAPLNGNGAVLSEAFVKAWCMSFEKLNENPYRPTPKDFQSAHDLFAAFKKARPRDFHYVACQMWLATANREDINAEEEHDPLFYSTRGSKSLDFFCRHAEKIIGEQDDAVSNIVGKIKSSEMDQVMAAVLAASS